MKASKIQYEIVNWSGTMRKVSGYPLPDSRFAVRRRHRSYVIDHIETGTKTVERRYKWEALRDHEDLLKEKGARKYRAAVKRALEQRKAAEAMRPQMSIAEVYGEITIQ